MSYKTLIIIVWRDVVSDVFFLKKINDKSKFLHRCIDIGLKYDASVAICSLSCLISAL